MHIYHDDDEWESVYHHRVCTACNGDLRKCNGACNGMAGYSLVRRKPEDVQRIKEERLKKHEDAVLIEADAIRARRS